MSASMNGSLHPDSLAHAVLEVAELASATAMRWFKQSFDVDVKGDGSPVTIADRSAELAAREWIAQRFPNDGILGEEMPAVREGATRRWLIDPIDGTKAFVRGVPLWGALVAVVEGDEVVAGAASYPAVQESITAAVGAGCWWNGARAHVSTIDTLASATLLTTDNRFPEHPHRHEQWRAMAAQCGVVRTWGDCYGYLLVATGRAEIMVDDIVNPWDAAAVVPIISEAGGVITDWRGQRASFGANFGADLIATNAALANVTRSLLHDGR